MGTCSEFCYIIHVLNIFGDCELTILIRWRLKEDAVPDVPMCSEKTISQTISQTNSQAERAHARTLQHVVRGE